MSRSRLRLLAVLLAAVALAAAGCLASDDEGAETASEDEPTEQEVGGQTQDVGNESVEEEETGPETTWDNDTREGSFRGANAVVLIVQGERQSFDVKDGALELRLQISSEEGELTGNIQPPCDDDGVAGTGLFPDCPSERYETEDGTANWSTDDPKPGEWYVTVFRGEEGAGSHSYTLDIGRLLLVEE